MTGAERALHACLTALLFASALLACDPAAASAGTPPCYVPRVLGDELRWAEQRIGEACRVRVEFPRGSRPRHPVVLEQRPRPGATAPAGTIVVLRAGAPIPPTRACRVPRFSRVIADTTALVAWQTPVAEEAISYVACVPPAGRKRTFYVQELGLTSGSSAPTVRTAGHLIAASGFGGDHYGNGSAGIDLFDAALGKDVFSASYGFGSAEGQPSYVAIRALALNSRGDLTWVRRVSPPESVPAAAAVDTVAVWNGHTARDLESAGTINGLKLAGGAVEWLSAGVPHSAPVEPPSAP